MNVLHISHGSLSELDTHLEIALRLNYLGNDLYTKLDDEMRAIDNMLTGLIKSQQSV